MNFGFIGGSMGSVVGELISRAIVQASKDKIPLILVCKSGGARMQEGAISLMQLAKVSSKLAKFSKEGGLYITILTDPTTGGVTASYGMLGDIIIAEPGALIGFAGPRVIKQTIGQDLPEGFQRSEFLLDKGFVDQIVPRDENEESIISNNRFVKLKILITNDDGIFSSGIYALWEVAKEFGSVYVVAPNSQKVLPDIVSQSQSLYS